MLTRSKLCLLGAALLLSACADSKTCKTSAVRYDYPQQRLDQALQDFSHKSGCFVEVDPALLQNQQAHKVHGSYKPKQALAHILHGTGLKGSRTDNGMKIQAR
ncbi:MAG: STN domain-containing protein [Acetobacter orientalis]|uniref:STN domain-containing protein n=1 Tax=Acetobacter orientalis TaxID=146474 RepID=UPI0039E9009D